MTKLYLIRHAEAEGNLYRRIHGHYDSKITQNGTVQLEALAKRFADIPLNAIYSSDLIRARNTAEAIAKGHDLSVETCPDLREISLGVWEDRTWGEVEMTQGASMALFRESSPNWKVKDSETFEVMQKRVHGALVEIANRHPNQTIAVASHGTAIRFACAAFLGLSLEESRTLGHSDNTAVSLLEFHEQGVKLVFADDNSHLSPDISTLGRQKWWKEGNSVVLDENLWFAPMDFTQFLYKGLYLASRQEAWTDLGRHMSYFGRQPYLEQAEACLANDPHHLLCAMRRNTIVGILQLDATRCEENNALYISFLYMLPEFRDMGLGVQMLGEATSVCRKLGKDRLHLYCGVDNSRGLQFYQRYGFCIIDQREEPFGELFLLEQFVGLD